MGSYVKPAWLADHDKVYAREGTWWKIPEADRAMAIDDAVRLAIYDQNAGKATTLADAARFTTGGKANGPFRVEVSSAKKYGFLRSEDGARVTFVNYLANL